MLRRVALAQHIGHGDERFVIALVLFQRLPAGIAEQHRVARPGAVAVQLDAVLDEQFKVLASAFQQQERHPLMRQALEPAKQAPFIIDDKRRGLFRHHHRIEETDPGVVLGVATEGRLDRGRVRLDQRVEHIVHCRPGAQ
ncbi:hypothetical protein D3C80_1138800 [compost metagenome]